MLTSWFTTPWTVTFGESKDMRKSTDLLDSLKETIINAYVGRTGVERESVSSMMNEETWLTAPEALEYGFITEITEPLKMAASFDSLCKFGNLPKSLVAAKVAADLPARTLPVSVVELQALNAKLTKEIGDLRTTLAKSRESLRRLEVLKGVNEAAVVYAGPKNFPYEGIAGTVYEQWAGMPEGFAKDKFYVDHEKELVKFINQPVPRDEGSTR
jgi:Clp protease